MKCPSVGEVFESCIVQLLIIHRGFIFHFHAVRSNPHIFLYIRPIFIVYSTEYSSYKDTSAERELLFKRAIAIMDLHNTTLALSTNSLAGQNKCQKIECCRYSNKMYRLSQNDNLKLSTTCKPFVECIQSML